MRWLLIVGLAGCGRIGFDIGLGAGDGDAMLAHDSTGVGLDGPLEQGLVAWFQLEDPSGLVFVDSVAGNNGTCAPPSCPVPTSTAHIGLASEFDGLDDCIKVLDVGHLDAPHFTVALWSVHFADAAMSLASKVSGPAITPSDSWQIELVPPGMVSFTSDRGAGTIQYVSPPDTLMVGVYQHVAITYNGAGALTYVDGTLVTSMLDMNPIVFDSGALYLGCDLDGGGPDSILGGNLDDVRIYDRALDASEIAALAAM